MKRTILLFLFLFISLSCQEESYSQEYIIGEGDILVIRVYDNPELDTTVRVGGDGIISMPLLGPIKVGGMDVAAIAGRLEALLGDGYLLSPKVNVFVQEYRSKKVTILGQVNRPGLIELQGSITLLELISRAEGLTEDAGGLITIKRKMLSDDSENKVINIDIKRLIEQGDTSINIPIQDGDSIYVAKAGVFFVTGEVQRPGSYKHEDDPSVLKAITLAGGLTDHGAPGRIRIIRIIDGKEVILKNVAMDELVMPDDVIVVPETYF
ncbi:MAG: periplasmic polysaccharide biosynthesis/export protein [Desulfobacterales bacterium SG8_35]|nr:MAG: periplasmic polysaccharide biosynthesis/export protein [Desulfobacterales bacterium SG8_35]